jgi:hypothetical protein
MYRLSISRHLEMVMMQLVMLMHTGWFLPSAVYSNSSS